MEVIFYFQKYWGRLPFSEKFEVLFHFGKFLCLLPFWRLNWGRLPFAKPKKPKLALAWLSVVVCLRILFPDQRTACSQASQLIFNSAQPAIQCHEMFGNGRALEYMFKLNHRNCYRLRNLVHIFCCFHCFCNKCWKKIVHILGIHKHKLSRYNRYNNTDWIFCHP